MKLTEAQFDCLTALGLRDHDYYIGERNPTMCALFRRGLVEQISVPHPHNSAWSLKAWRITPAGRAALGER